jgi:hypothetical protein
MSAARRKFDKRQTIRKRLLLFAESFANQDKGEDTDE